MYRARALSIVAGCVLVVLHLDRVRLRRGDQLGFGLANLELLELCRGLSPICGAQFSAGVHEVARDGVRTEAEPLRNLAIG